MGWLINKIRTRLWTTFYYILSDLFFYEMGRGCQFEGWVDIPQRKGRIILGDRVHICRRSSWTVTEGSVLRLSDGTYIGPGVVLSAHRAINIGRDTLIAEYVSIYDNEHVWSDAELPIGKQGYKSEACSIGDRCWIGSGARILVGGSLGDESILGAGAVLKKKLPGRVVAVGVPARIMKERNGKGEA